MQIDLKRFHVTRFNESTKTYEFDKSTNFVEFPTGERALNMAPYAANPTSVQYSLYGICNHTGKLSDSFKKNVRFCSQLITLMSFIGSLKFGHYVAACKHPTTGEWHNFDDAK